MDTAITTHLEQNERSCQFDSMDSQAKRKLKLAAGESRSREALTLEVHPKKKKRRKVKHSKGSCSDSSKGATQLLRSNETRAEYISSAPMTASAHTKSEEEVKCNQEFSNPGYF